LGGFQRPQPGVGDDLSRYYNEITRLDQEFQWVLDNVG
jgi:hypothetical protein